MSKIITIKEADGTMNITDETELGDGKTLKTDLGTVPFSLVQDQLYSHFDRIVMVPRIQLGRVMCWAQRRNNYMYVVTNRPAKVKIREKYDTKISVERTIALPWVIYGVHLKNGAFTSLYVFFRNEEPLEADDQLYYAALPNVHKESNVCMGNDEEAELVGLNDHGQIIDVVIRSFRRSTFTTGVTHTVVAARQNIMGYPDTFQEWEELSADPMRSQQILTLRWLDSGHTIASLLAMAT